MGAGAPQGLSRGVRIWIVVAAVLGVCAIVFQLLLRTDTHSFRAQSEAMEPTIEDEERFTANEEAYGDDGGPERGDLVVLYPPQGAVEDPDCARTVPSGQMCDAPRGGPADVTFVKRVVALPGERVSVRDGLARIDGRALDEPYANLRSCANNQTCDFPRPITVRDGHYLVLGDNRGRSVDSRFWGPVPRDQIFGRVDECLPFGLRCKEDDRTG